MYSVIFGRMSPSQARSTKASARASSIVLGRVVDSFAGRGLGGGALHRGRIAEARGFLGRAGGFRRDRSRRPGAPVDCRRGSPFRTLRSRGVKAFRTMRTMRPPRGLLGILGVARSRGSRTAAAASRPRRKKRARAGEGARPARPRAPAHPGDLHRAARDRRRPAPGPARSAPSVRTPAARAWLEPESSPAVAGPQRTLGDRVRGRARWHRGGRLPAPDRARVVGLEPRPGERARTLPATRPRSARPRESTFEPQEGPQGLDVLRARARLAAGERVKLTYGAGSARRDGRSLSRARVALLDRRRRRRRRQRAPAPRLARRRRRARAGGAALGGAAEHRAARETITLRLAFLDRSGGRGVDVRRAT